MSTEVVKNASKITNEIAHVKTFAQLPKIAKTGEIKQIFGNVLPKLGKIDPKWAKQVRFDRFVGKYCSLILKMGSILQRMQ